MSALDQIDKAKEPMPQNEAIGQFLEWLFNQGYEIGKWHTRRNDLGREVDEFFTEHRSEADWLYLYLGIDPHEADRERNALLVRFREVVAGDVPSD